MRVPSVTALLAFSLGTCFAQQAPTPTPHPAASPAISSAPAARTGMTTFRSDTLHLAYSYPSTYTDASSMVSEALQAGMTHDSAGGKDLSHCLTFPLSAMDASGGGLGLVLLGRADAACMKKKFTAEQLPEYTQSEVQELTGFGAHPEFGQPVPFIVQGHAADLVRGTFSLPTGQRLHTLVACVLLKPDVVCWQFLAGSDERLNIMGAFPVSLDGGKARH